MVLQRLQIQAFFPHILALFSLSPFFFQLNLRSICVIVIAVSPGLCLFSSTEVSVKVVIVIFSHCLSLTRCCKRIEQFIFNSYEPP